MGKNKPTDYINWLFLIIFVITGVLNLILVHPVPGIFYILLSALYLPQTKKYIPNSVKIIIGLVILWGTLAVGDLAEILGL